MVIVVVGAGIAGVACAKALVEAGHEVRVLDRGRRIGGRLGLREVPTGAVIAAPHVVDIGGSYLTVSDEGFAAVVRDWTERGLAREWTDTFHVSNGRGLQRTTTGPMRYGSTEGLRGLVEDLAYGLDVRHPIHVKRIAPGAENPWIVEVEGGEDLSADAVVVAAPDPQAARLMPSDLVAAMHRGGPWSWNAVIAVAAAWDQRWWAGLDGSFGHPFEGAFVNDDVALTWIADDGRRRGDTAAVLVAHTTPEAAAGWLAEPALALVPVLEAVGRVLGVSPPPPVWSHVQRWGLAQPTRDRPAPPYFLHRSGLGVCGDAWGERSSVEGAWLSGTTLGSELASRLD